MPKTNLVNGSIVTPDYLNSINGTDAVTGHTHDGTNDDGSVPKIDLDNGAHVTGELPIDFMGDFSLNFLVEFSLDFGVTYTVTKGVDLTRIGNSITILLRLGNDFDENMTANAPLMLRPNGGGSWPSAIFGVSGNSMQSNFFRMLVSPAPSPNLNIGYASYTGPSNAIEIRKTDGSTFATSDNVRIFNGSFANFVLALDTTP